MKKYMGANMKVKHTWKQKKSKASVENSYIFEDPIYIFSDNGSKKQKETWKQTSKSKPSKF